MCRADVGTALVRADEIAHARRPDGASGRPCRRSPLASHGADVPGRARRVPAPLRASDRLVPVTGLGGPGLRSAGGHRSDVSCLPGALLFNLGFDDESLTAKRSMPGPGREGWWTGHPRPSLGMRSILHLARKDVAEFSNWVERTRAHSVDRNLPYWTHLSEPARRLASRSQR